MVGPRGKKTLLSTSWTVVCCSVTNLPISAAAIGACASLSRHSPNSPAPNTPRAVTSGTAALKVALSALGVGAGDEVITQGFTFVATWEAILDTGAVPVFCEVDETLCLDPDDLKKKITERTKCIVPVHMMGSQARINEIKAIADAKGIPVLEDTAQSAGGFLNGKHLGTIGKVGTLQL